MISVIIPTHKPEYLERTLKSLVVAGHGFDYEVIVCENPEQTQHAEYIEWAKNHLWIGGSKNKGLGIFAAEHLAIESLGWSNTFTDHTVKYFLPCIVNNDFQLVGVWTHQNNSPNFGYIGQFWKYIQVNKHNFGKVIVAGDFNSNTIWENTSFNTPDKRFERKRLIVLWSGFFNPHNHIK